MQRDKSELVLLMRLVKRPALWTLTVLLFVAGCARSCNSGNGPGKSVTVKGPEPISEQLWSLNNQGVAYLERFDKTSSSGEVGYTKAVEVFEEIVRRWPNWSPGKFNLAIARINEDQSPDNLETAERLLREALADDSSKPKYHYGLGFLLQYLGRIDEARAHFEQVCLRLLPTDAHSWVRLGDCLGDAVGPEGLTAQKCYEKALELNPYLPAPMHKLQLALRRAGDHESANELLERLDKTKASLNYAEFADPYVWAGPLAEAIGATVPAPRPSAQPLPVYVPSNVVFELPEGGRWATLSDLQRAEHGALLVRIQHRFGGGICAFDYDRDGDLDLFLPASVVAGNRIRDGLFRNEGDGRFVDVTSAAGLDGQVSIGCTVGDFDADGLSDVYVTTCGANRLFRNTREGRFEDVTSLAGAAEEQYVSLSALFADIDHDSDLDLIVANYGPSTDASQMFGDPAYSKGASNALFLNVGKANLGAEGALPPLQIAFEKASEQLAFANEHAATVGFAAADFDDDRDLDLIEVNDNAPCRLLTNRRLDGWHATPMDPELVPTQQYNGAFVADYNNDTGIDLVFIATENAPLILRNATENEYADRIPVFQSMPIDLGRVRNAQALDMNFDGWTDVMALGVDVPIPVLAVNHSRGLMLQDWMDPQAHSEHPTAAALAADIQGDLWPELILLREGAPPAVLHTQGNGATSVAIRLTGRPERVPAPDKKTMRSNTDAIGTRVMVHAGQTTVTWENTTLSAGLSRSLTPLAVGLAGGNRADAIRLRWPDGVEQAELNLLAGERVTIDETQRRGTSCPLLFTWNGRRFEFITDFLGGGGIGYLVAPGVYSEPDPDEDVKIEADQLAVDDRGRYVVKIAEPMDEMTYLDAALLEVVDHPKELTVYPDERFNPESPHVSGGRMVFDQPIVPRAAVDQRGNDVRAALAENDRHTVGGFRKSAMWIGYAERHFLELDFGNMFAGLADGEPIALILAGWIEYPYSETNWAASTAGVRLEPPVVQYRNAQGRWETLVANMGYPAGLPRVMTLELTGKLPAAVRDGRTPCRLRIATNMEIYWDQIYAARLLPLDSVRRTVLAPAEARLGYRGYLQEYSPDGRLPKLFDYDQIIAVPLVGLKGRRTPYGDVRELVTKADDRFALVNAGDEVTLSYDATALPPLPEGWTRSFVLRSFGYCKEVSLFNPAGETVEPLPRRGEQLVPAAQRPPAKEVAIERPVPTGR